MSVYCNLYVSIIYSIFSNIYNSNLKFLLNINLLDIGLSTIHLSFIYINYSQWKYQIFLLYHFVAWVYLFSKTSNVISRKYWVLQCYGEYRCPSRTSKTTSSSMAIRIFKEFKVPLWINMTLTSLLLLLSSISMTRTHLRTLLVANQDVSLGLVSCVPTAHSCLVRFLLCTSVISWDCFPELFEWCCPWHGSSLGFWAVRKH